MRPLKRYISHLYFQIDKPPDVITRCLQTKLKQVVVISKIQIVIKPTFFDTTTGRGYINIKILAEEKASSSALAIEVIPTSYTRESLTVSIIVLLLFTLAWLIFAPSFYAGLAIIIVWIFLPCLCILPSN